MANKGHKNSARRRKLRKQEEDGKVRLKSVSFSFFMKKYPTLVIFDMGYDFLHTKIEKIHTNF